MIVDGREIAGAIYDALASEIAVCGCKPVLSVLTCAPNFATRKFLKIKRDAAARFGVVVRLEELALETTTEHVLEVLQHAISTSHGVIIQLPFPEHIDIERVLDALPASHDVDAIGKEARERLLSGDTDVLPPVTGAIAEIVKRHNVVLKDTEAAVVGHGRLVGKPTSAWLSAQGAKVNVIERNADLSAALRAADIVVLGAGVPKMVTPEMIKEGVIIFDAGTSEDAGELVGDADPRCAEKAALFTPVPGGIGPITIAVIFKNLVTLTLRAGNN